MPLTLADLGWDAEWEAAFRPLAKRNPNWQPGRLIRDNKISYGALLDASYLPPSVKSVGPFFHVNHEFETVDGLIVPVRYSVHGKDGSRTIVGNVSSWSWSEEFDQTRLEKPPEAVVDGSSPRRRVE